MVFTRLSRSGVNEALKLSRCAQCYSLNSLLEQGEKFWYFEDFSFIKYIFVRFCTSMNFVCQGGVLVSQADRRISRAQHVPAPASSVQNAAGRGFVRPFYLTIVER